MNQESLNIREEVYQMNTFSFSRLKKFADCPFQFFQNYVLEKQEDKTYPLALGSAVHKAIEQRLHGMNLNMAIGEAILEQDFFEGLTYDEIEQLVLTAPVDKINQKDDVKIESGFNIPLNSDEKNSPKVRGFIDVLANNKEIIDWKTNQRTYDITDNHQQGLYAWAIRQTQNMYDNIEGSLYFLRSGWYSKHVYTPEDQEHARKWAYDTAKDIQSRLQKLRQEPTLEKAAELFPADTNGVCSYCPFASECFTTFNPLEVIS